MPIPQLNEIKSAIEAAAIGMTGLLNKAIKELWHKNLQQVVQSPAQQLERTIDSANKKNHGLNLGLKGNLGPGNNNNDTHTPYKPGK